MGRLLLAVLFLSGLSCSRERGLSYMGEAAEIPAEVPAGGVREIAEKVPAAAGEVSAEVQEPERPALGDGVLPDFITMDTIAEIERSGGFTQGMGLTESILREKSGDYGGAVLAAYKELSWLYGYGGMDKRGITEGLNQILTLYGEDVSAREPESPSAGERAAAVLAARGTLAYLDGDWAVAGDILEPLFAAEEEPDAFSQWMLLACSLEGGENTRPARAAYGAIRARYLNFPEYWYRGARCFSGETAADYAERCINLAPQGPFAGECRTILALGAGLSAADGEAIRSGAEIDAVIAQSVSGENPELLSELFPLIALPDNPYTLYASGALRALAALESFKNYFTSAGGQNSGRLAERLRYISRG
jgi:hypothetical protein